MSHCFLKNLYQPAIFSRHVLKGGNNHSYGNDLAVDTILEQQHLGIDIKKWRQQQQEGEANDSLCSLCDYIHHSQALKQQNNSHNNAVHGQEKNTRAVKVIKDVEGKIQNHKSKYRLARSAMINLGCNPADPTFGFPELKDNDLYTRDVNQPHQLGDGSKSEGWIWQVGKYGNPSEEEQAKTALDGRSIEFHCFLW